jgi:hypothetical protein
MDASMPISFACPCGKKFEAKDEHAGKKGVCPACRREFLVPAPYDIDLSVPAALKQIELGHQDDPVLPIPIPVVRPVARPAASAPPRKPEPAQTSAVAPDGPTEPKRPLWKDPVVVIGAAVPTLILTWFFSYLAWPHVKAWQARSACDSEAT